MVDGLSPHRAGLREIVPMWPHHPKDSHRSTCEGAAKRLIAHLDMDAFFASVELLRFPQLKGLAVVVGGRSRTMVQAMQDLEQAYGSSAAIDTNRFPRLSQYQGRGVITTASYAARAFGIGSGMGLMKAAQRCPDAILLPADFERYRDYSRRFKAVIRAQGLAMEDRGIDEVYIDLSFCSDHDQARALAQQLQNAILQETGLSCSMGLAPNKLLAKLASDMQKPSGLTVLGRDSMSERLWPLPVARLHGVGPQTAKKLHALGLEVIGQIATSHVDSLQRVFGLRQARWLIDASWGIDERPLVLESEPLSMSRETTLERDMHPRQDRDFLTAIFTRLCQQLAADLQNKHRECRSISVKIRNDQFKTVTRDVSFAESTDDPVQIRHWAGQCLKRFAFDRRIRLLGVKASRLSLKSSATANPDRAKSIRPGEAMHLKSLATNDPDRYLRVAETQHRLWPELDQSQKGPKAVE